MASINLTEYVGVHAVGQIVTGELRWIFREKRVADVGIDAEIERVNEHNSATGQLIAVQIKTGASNFREKGERLVYRGKNSHLVYWLDHALPVILVAHLPRKRATYWVQVTEEAVRRTGETWTIDIPKANLLNGDARGPLERVFESRRQWVPTPLTSDEGVEHVDPVAGGGSDLSDAQQQLLDVLLDTPKSAEPEVATEIIRRVADEGAITLRQYLLKRWATWARQTGGRLHQRFVPLALSTRSALALGKDPQTRLTFAGIDQLFEPDSGLSEASGFVLRGVPGAGKTVLHRRREMDLCRQALLDLRDDKACIEVPLYLSLGAMEANEVPREWVRRSVRAAYPDADELQRLLLGKSEQRGRLHLLLDGLNELKVGPGQLREQRAAQVVTALHQDLLKTAAKRVHGQMLLSIRDGHTLLPHDPTSGPLLLEVEVQPWDDFAMQRYLVQRFSEQVGAQLFAALREQPPALELCRTPLHMDGQCELFEQWSEPAQALASGAGAGTAKLAPVVMPDRASLFCAWLWQRLHRGLQMTDAGRLRVPLLLQEEWFTAEDRASVSSREAWLGPRLRRLPDGGCLLPLLYEQAERQWLAASKDGKDTAERGEVVVTLRSVREALAQTGARGRPALDREQIQTWLDAVRDLGLVSIDPALEEFRFVHQAWGEFLCSRHLLPPEPPQDAGELAALLRGLAPPALQTSDSEAVAALHAAAYERWNRVPAETWVQVDAALTLPLAQAQEELEKTDWTKAKVDRWVQQGWLKRSADELSCNVAAMLQEIRIRGHGNHERELVASYLAPPFQPLFWQALGKWGDTLRSSKDLLQEPPAGDLDEPLVLALQGLDAPLPWLRVLCQSPDDRHLRAAARAAAGLLHRWEGERAASDEVSAAKPVLRHMRQRLLLANVATGGSGVVPPGLQSAGLQAGDDGVWGPNGEAADDELARRWQGAWAAAWDGLMPDVRHRMHAGRLLGEVGDRLRYEECRWTDKAGREHKGLRLHRRHWVGAGEPGRRTSFRLGEAAKDNASSVIVELAYFEMAAFKLTVAEWQAFVDDDGYDVAAPWWGPAGSPAHSWLTHQPVPRRPFAWGQAWAAGKLQPVVGITFWESLAFSRWAGPMYDLGDGLQLGIPTEAQHEAALRGPPPATDGLLRWPGMLPDQAGPSPLHFNHEALRWAIPSPVGTFGASYADTGLADPCGNTWDWTASRGIAADWFLHAEDREATCGGDLNERRARRGGSHFNSAADCGIGKRYDAPADYDYNNIGLRLARVGVERPGP